MSRETTNVYEKEKPGKILIINPFGIGDVLFSSCLIHNLKENLPQAKIGFLCNKRTEPILQDNPYVDYVFVYERDEFQEVKETSKLLWIKKHLDFLTRIKKERFDVVFDLSLNSQFGFFAWYSGIKTRIGYDYKKRGRFLTNKIPLEGYQDKHVVEYYLELLKFLGIDSGYKQIELFIRSNAIKADQLLPIEETEGHLLIAIAPCGGASWGTQSYIKHWPKENFTQLANRLIDKYKAKIILTGSNKEKGVIEYIANKLTYQPIEAVGLPLRIFFSVLKKVDILITNDGGPLHMAVGLGVKTVSLFGPVSEIVYGPYSNEPNKHIVLNKDLFCRPCYKKFRMPECPYQRRCLTDITVDDVYSAVESLL